VTPGPRLAPLLELIDLEVSVDRALGPGRFRGPVNDQPTTQPEAHPVATVPVIGAVGVAVLLGPVDARAVVGRSARLTVRPGQATVRRHPSSTAGADARVPTRATRRADVVLHGDGVVLGAAPPGHAGEGTVRFPRQQGDFYSEAGSSVSVPPLSSLPPPPVSGVSGASSEGAASGVG
jgi:hypothetical protein